MKLSSRDRRAVVLGGAALGVIIAARVLLIPWFDSWADARSRIGAYKAQRTRCESVAAKILAQRARLSKNYGPAINCPLAADAEAAYVDLIRVAQEVLAAKGFAVSDYQQQHCRKVKSIHGVDVVPLQVRGACKVEQLTAALAALREAKSLVYVDRVTVTNSTKKPGQLEVTVVLATLAERKGAAS